MGRSRALVHEEHARAGQGGGRSGARGAELTPLSGACGRAGRASRLARAFLCVSLGLCPPARPPAASVREPKRSAAGQGRGRARRCWMEAPVRLARSLRNVPGSGCRAGARALWALLRGERARASGGEEPGRPAWVRAEGVARSVVSRRPRGDGADGGQKDPSLGAAAVRGERGARDRARPVAPPRLARLQRSWSGAAKAESTSSSPPPPPPAFRMLPEAPA